MKIRIKQIITVILALTISNFSYAGVIAKHYNKDQIWKLSDEKCPESKNWKRAFLAVPMLDKVLNLGACWAIATDDPSVVVMCRTANGKILSDCLYVSRTLLMRP